MPGRSLLLVPWEFFRFNVLAAGSAQYGSHSWHWSATQGFPVIAATLLPLGLAGIATTSRRAFRSICKGPEQVWTSGKSQRPVISGI